MAAETYVFNTALVGFRGVSRKLAVRGDETLADLHQLLQLAFDWDDDHLYSFWLSGTFWDSQSGSEYTCPSPWLERGQRTARVRLDRLGLRTGQKIAYVFDFGDEWRVRLTLVEIRAADAEPCPPILVSRGEAPPQYVYDDDELAETA
ncbi:MAG: plasmid pRiA4b ORF-3 family protein [Gaiellaceae bacterium]